MIACSQCEKNAANSEELNGLCDECVSTIKVVLSKRGGAGRGQGRKPLAMTAGVGVVGTEFPITRRRDDDGPLWPPKQEPDNRGRRAEKNALALAKAEAKRQRRAEKRLKDMGPNANVTGLAPAEEKTRE